MKIRILWVFLPLIALQILEVQAQELHRDPYVPVIMLLASPEEGARIFTLVRLVPRDHPIAIGHELPTLQSIHPSEVEVLIHLGRAVGFGLRPTLERHGRVSNSWPYYPGLRFPDYVAVETAPVDYRDDSNNQIPGLRAVAFVDQTPVATLIDTRRLTLQERRMERATSSDLDIMRAELEDALNRLSSTVQHTGASVIVFGGRG